MTRLSDVQRINGTGALRLLAEGSDCSAQLLELRLGPLAFPVSRFSTGEFVLDGVMHDLVMQGLVDLEQKGEDPDDRASWWYLITDEGRDALANPVYGRP